jgi:hypothetical protein
VWAGFALQVGLAITLVVFAAMHGKWGLIAVGPVLVVLSIIGLRVRLKRVGRRWWQHQLPMSWWERWVP